MASACPPNPQLPVDSCDASGPGHVVPEILQPPEETGSGWGALTLQPPTPEPGVSGAAQRGILTPTL